MTTLQNTTTPHNIAAEMQTQFARIQNTLLEGSNQFTNSYVSAGKLDSIVDGTPDKVKPVSQAKNTVIKPTSPSKSVETQLLNHVVTAAYARSTLYNGRGVNISPVFAFVVFPTNSGAEFMSSITHQNNVGFNTITITTKSSDNSKVGESKTMDIKMITGIMAVDYQIYDDKTIVAVAGTRLSSTTKIETQEGKSIGNIVMEHRSSTMDTLASKA